MSHCNEVPKKADFLLVYIEVTFEVHVAVV